MNAREIGGARKVVSFAKRSGQSGFDLRRKIERYEGGLAEGYSRFEGV